MSLGAIDWAVVALYGLITTVLGFWFTRRAGQSVDDYFLAGRSLPWWLAGTSIAATWFATDAPLATASLVRQQGIFGNWLWWYEAAGILMLVYFYARLWRRAEVVTDAEFIELRYSGKPASALRGFGALYQGVLKNAVVMGWVMLAMVKFARVLLGWDATFTLTVCVSLALVYTVASGLWGVVLTDLFQFVAGMVGSVALAGIVLWRVGGPASLARQIRALPDAPPGALDMVPTPSHVSSLEMASFVVLIGFMWLRSGQGDGYLAQRLFATRDERQSVLASLWFSFAGTVLLTWPWIIVGLGSLILLPAASAVPELLADPELAYPMMVAQLLPPGLKGLLVAAFLAAFMSTMDTHLCWGASYMVNDVYRRFLVRTASARHYVLASRVAVVGLALVAAMAAWQMDSIQRGWIYVIELTAGVALVWLLRWYWWRVNAWAEIAAMVGSVLLANGMVWARGAAAIGLLSSGGLSRIAGFYGPELDLIRAFVILLSCTALWVVVALTTAPDDPEHLDHFYRKVRPGGWWGPVARRCPEVRPDGSAARSWLGWGLGVTFVYGSLLGIGYLMVGNPVGGVLLLALAAVGGVGAVSIARSGPEQAGAVS